MIKKIIQTSKETGQMNKKQFNEQRHNSNEQRHSSNEQINSSNEQKTYFYINQIGQKSNYFVAHMN